MSQKHGYQPLHEPAKYVSFDRMQEILARHSQPKEEVMQPATDSKSIPDDAGAASAENTPERLEWVKPASPLESLITTKCGRFRCRKTNYTGDWRYQMEIYVENLWWYDVGVSLSSFKEIQALAQKHADGLKD